MNYPILYIFIVLNLFILTQNKYELKDDYSLSAIFYTHLPNQKIPLINIPSSKIIKIKIDNTEIKPNNEYIFPNIGKHEVYILIDNKQMKSLEKMFYNIKNLESIFFYEKFNTENITNFNKMFYGCSSLKNINISFFNAKV